ncbi:MAG: YiaA/YiaB family inner membrane protein [Bacteroidota bacterium]
MSTYIYENQNSKSFYTMSWIAFIIAAVGMVAGLIYIDADLATKGFLGMSYLFSITSCFTVAKVVRDRHEAEKFVNKVEHAKTEKFLNERNDVLSNV